MVENNMAVIENQETIGEELKSEAQNVAKVRSESGVNIGTQNLKSFIENNKTILFWVAGAFLTIALTFTAVMMLKPKYQTLFTGLEQSDAAAIGSFLQKEKIKFQISPNGEAISVADTSVPKLRLRLASKGLPRGSGVGFEIFDKTNLSVTDFKQKVDYNRALEGELSRTIASLENIKSAKVHLALAKKSLFKKTQGTSTASVVITTMSPDIHLNEEQIRGIRHLVASAIQGLEPAQVQITDNLGNSLVVADEKAALEHKKMIRNENKLKDYERDLEASLLELLSPILGAKNVLVNVKADMNFDESEMNIEVFSPIDTEGTRHEPVVRSEKISTEKYSNGKDKMAGIPGTENNMPTFTGLQKQTDSQKNKDYQKEDVIKNYEVSKSVERVLKATGLVEKVSVAVVINKDLNPSERVTLRKTVIAAAGLNLDRGDQVAITGIRFSSAPHLNRAEKQQSKEVAEMERKAMVKKYTALAISLFIALIAIVLLLLSLKAPIDASQAERLEELLDQEDMPLLESLNDKLKEAEEAFHRKLQSESKSDLVHMKKELSRISQEQPHLVVRGLKNYMND